MNTIRAVLLALALTSAVTGPAVAGAPTEALRVYVERAVALLGDAQTDAAPTLTRQRALRALAHEAVDFGAAAQASLGMYWDACTPGERAHFVQLFTRLVDASYLPHLPNGGARLDYDRERTNGAVVEVHARALGRKGDVTPVIFSLRQDLSARWRIVDVSVEGMSLIGSYRAQFNRILRTSSFDDLVRRLEAKIRDTSRVSAMDTSPATSAP